MNSPTRNKAILAKCHDCMGEYLGGRMDCRVTKCPLYFWMPYREIDPNLEWMNYNPRRKGAVLKNAAPKRTLTDEEREKRRKNLETARKNKTT